jgi:hypothetical protein
MFLQQLHERFLKLTTTLLRLQEIPVFDLRREMSERRKQQSVLESMFVSITSVHIKAESFTDIDAPYSV